MNKSIRRGFLVLLLGATLSGCAMDHQLVLQGTTRDTLQNGPTFEALVTQYQQGANAEQARNQIIRRLMLADDEYFLAYANQLYHGRALADTAGEVVDAGLTTAATAVSPAAAAKVLTGIAAGLIASKVSVDKNFFMQQASSALIAKMEAQRAIVDTRIQGYLKQPVEDYPLEEGLRDFIKYYRAGTLASAAQSLTADAEVQHDDASDALHEVKKAPSALATFTTPDRRVTVRRSPTAGTIRAGAEVVPFLPPEFRARNRRLRDAFEKMSPTQAQVALVKDNVTLPAKADPQEFLAEQILAKAGLDSHHKGGTAVESLTYYRRSAVDDAKLTNLEQAYGAFLPLPDLAKPLPPGGATVAMPTTPPAPTP